MKTALRHGMRVTLLGMAASAVLATVKLVTGLVGHSYVLVADAVESFADIAGAAIVWGGLSVSARPPDENHPYGHGKAEPLAGLAVGLMLVAAAVGICVKAVDEIITPQLAPAPFTLIVLVVVIVVKELLFRISSRVATEIDSAAVKADAWHHRSDAFTSLAACAGISISLYGGPGYEAADDWAAVVAAAIIAINGLRFIRITIDELMDAQPPVEVVTAMRNAAHDVNGVMFVEKTMARKVGTTYWVDMHVEVDGEISVREGHDLAHLVKEAVQSRVPTVVDVMVHIEPHEDE